MENTIITSEGFSIGDLRFAGFVLTRGEYLSIDFPDSLDFKVENALCEILSGNSKVEGFSVMENVIPVKTPMMKPGPALFSMKTSFKYLKENGSFTESEMITFLKEIDIDPKINIYRLGANERKLLSLEAAYSKSKNIIISTAGLDYNGIEKIRSRIKREINTGSLIELSYPSSWGREYLFDELGTNHKMVTVK